MPRRSNFIAKSQSAGTDLMWTVLSTYKRPEFVCTSFVEMIKLTRATTQFRKFDVIKLQILFNLCRIGASRLILDKRKSRLKLAQKNVTCFRARYTLIETVLF